MFLLTAIITDSVVTLGARWFYAQSFHREYHKYIAKDDQTEFTEEYERGKTVNIRKQEEKCRYERYDIYLIHVMKTGIF